MSVQNRPRLLRPRYEKGKPEKLNTLNAYAESPFYHSFFIVCNDSTIC